MKRSALAAQVAALALSVMLTRETPSSEQQQRGSPPASRGTRAFAVTPQSYNADARTVEAVFSAGSPVSRWFGVEQLQIAPESIDLSRVASGLCPLLNAHNSYDIGAVLGRVIDARIENDQLVGTIQFGDTDAARAAEAMVARGEVLGISIGYVVRTWTLTAQTDVADTWTATSWELLEVSLVPVPADPVAGVRSAGVSTPEAGARAEHQEETEDMLLRNQPGGAAAPVQPAIVAPGVSVPEVRSEAAPPAPAAPVVAASRFSAIEAVDFLDQARSFGVETRARELVEQNGRGEVGTDAARAAILQAAAEHQRAQAGGVSAAPAIPGTPGLRVSEANAIGSRAAMAAAIAARCLGEQPTDQTREFWGLGFVEMAAARSNQRLGPDRYQIVRAANTSSDFPLLLEAAANKVLLARYGLAAPTFQAIAQRRDLTDFKTTKLLRVGDFPGLLPYAEDGEIKAGTINEGREEVILGSFGRILRLTRQAIINDDLGAFDDVFGSIGRMIARFENNTFYAMKAQNGGLGPKMADGKTLFHVAHGNIAGAGGAIAIDTVGAGRAAIRKQEDLDKKPLNLAPKIIVVGPDQETLAEQFLAPVQAQQFGNVNPFALKLNLVTDTEIEGNPWELYTDPADLAVFSYGYLRDAPGPQVTYEQGFNTDGMAWRVIEDFYCGAIDYRGAWRTRVSKVPPPDGRGAVLAHPFSFQPPSTLSGRRGGLGRSRYAQFQFEGHFPSPDRPGGRCPVGRAAADRRAAGRACGRRRRRRNLHRLSRRRLHLRCRRRCQRTGMDRTGDRLLG